MNKISNKNLVLILTYLLILSATLIGYLFMVAYQAEGYEPQIYKNAYVYFFIFQFMVFTIILPMWDHGQISKDLCKSEILKSYMYILVDSSLLSLSSIPLIMVIFISGQLNGINFILPLIIQIFWGIALLSLREYLNAKEKIKKWKNLIFTLFVFIVLVLTLVFLYFYIQYGKLVVTTVYDNDFSNIFFINPLLTITGLVYMQIGGDNYLGNLPFIISMLFCLFITIASFALTMREKLKKSGGKVYEKISCRPDTEKA